MNAVVDQAVVVGLVPYGDADAVVRFFTRHHGRVGAFARGARRSKRRFPGLTPLWRGEVELSARRADADLHRLERASVSHDPGGFGQSPEAFGRASYLVELVTRLLPDADPLPELYDDLDLALDRIAGGAGDARLLRAFELKLLGHTGYLPDLDDVDDVEASEAGGSAGRLPPLDAEARDAAMRLWTAPLDALPEVDLPTLRAVSRLFVGHLRRMEVGPLRSVEFLRALQGA